MFHTLRSCPDYMKNASNQNLNMLHQMLEHVGTAYAVLKIKPLSNQFLPTAFALCVSMDFFHTPHGKCHHPWFQTVVARPDLISAARVFLDVHVAMLGWVPASDVFTQPLNIMTQHWGPHCPTKCTKSLTTCGKSVIHRHNCPLTVNCQSRGLSNRVCV